MRDKSRIRARLEMKKARLQQYYEREAEMLDPDGVKYYTLGTRSISRYDTTLKDIQTAIKKLEDEIAELEAILAGDGARKAVGVIPRDW